MAKFKVVGLEAAFTELGEIPRDSEEIAKMCVYDGAGVIADAVKARINSIPTRDPKQRGTDKHKVRGATPDEKAALTSGLGIAHMRTAGGTVDTVIGFDGYMSVSSKGYPKGKPIPMIANSIEKGTSWLQRSPFITPAVKAAQPKAEAAMAARFDEELLKRGK